MNGQNPALTEHLKHTEAEMTRAYIVASMRWSCQKPTETHTEFVCRELDAAEKAVA